MKCLNAKIEKIKPLIIEFYNENLNNKFLSDRFNIEYLLSEASYMIENGFAFMIEEKGSIIGYLLSFKFPRIFFGEKSVITPIFGMYIKDNDLNYITAMFSNLYKGMLNEGYTHHIMSELGDYTNETLVDMGYGKRLKDASRYTENEIVDSSFKLVEAKEYDFKILIDIFTEHEQYLSSGTILLEREEDLEQELHEVIKDEDHKFMMFLEGDELIGFTILGNTPAGSPLLMDKETISIKGTHIGSSKQNKGYGKILLSLINNYCYRNNIKKQSTDFETMNYKANQFWTKHFNIIATTYLRYIGKK